MLSGYSDSDLAGEVDDSKSTRRMVFYLNESLPAGYLINSVVWLYHLVKLVHGSYSSCMSRYMVTQDKKIGRVLRRKENVPENC